MPFTRIQEAVTLATRVDTAMNRRDEIGMDMLRDLLPELREIIDNVNAALREVDELLFTGLRDEAISLNEPEFSKVAARLNLEDKSAWPETLAFFESEGITPPPKLDFETLAALESAHAEVEALARPLDMMRRLVLERAPLITRLEVLRRLRDSDGTKPVWAETIADHERARLAELPDIVRRTLAAKDAAGIAELHAELVDPEWSVSMPKDLVKATRGADLWARLRDLLPAAEAAAASLEAGVGADGAGTDPTAVASMRQARQEWYVASGAVHECLTGLAECPTVAALARDEELATRFATLAPRVQPALAWLEGIDANEAAWAQHSQAIDQLESYVARLPATARDEQAWLAGVEHLERQVGGSLSDDLRSRLAAAVANVRRRPGQRMAVMGGIGAAAVLALLGVVYMVRGCQSTKRARAEAIETLREEVAAAESGAYDTVLDDVNAIAEAYPDDKQVRSLVSKIETSVKREGERRTAVGSALADQSRLLDEAEEEWKRREASRSGLAPWPDVVAQAAKSWRSARAAGGQPAKRGANQSAAVADQRATAVLEKEEQGIEDARQKQEHVELKFSNQSKAAFQRRFDELKKEVAGLPASPDSDACRAIREGIEDLRAAAGADKIADAGVLIATSGKAFVPQAWLDAVDGLLRDLDMRHTRSPTPVPADAGAEP